jgi:hypothetical protein
MVGSLLRQLLFVFVHEARLRLLGRRRGRCACSCRSSGLNVDPVVFGVEGVAIEIRTSWLLAALVKLGLGRWKIDPMFHDQS